MGDFLECFHAVSNWIQNEFGGFEIIVSLTGAIFSVFAWIKAKSIEKKLSGKKPRDFGTGESHAVLAVDLTAEDRMVGNAGNMISQFAGWIKRSENKKKKLYNLVYDIEPLPESEAIHIDTGKFSINYITLSENNCSKGRFITMQGPKMPTESEGAKAYMESLNVAINILFAKLSERSVTSVHIIFQGPYVASMLFGTKLANHFKVYYYQYSDGQYYYVASGGKVGIR
jgi:hypothetical protein